MNVKDSYTEWEGVDWTYVAQDRNNLLITGTGISSSKKGWKLLDLLH